MANRRAVGATIVSIVLFTSLLVSSAVILASAEDKASASSLVDGEGTLYDNAVVMRGVVVLELLAKAQAALSSEVFACANATGEAHGAVRGLSASAANGVVSAMAVASAGDQGPGPDNLSLLKQFDGGLAGRFNVLVRTAVDGSYPGGRVAYAKSEYHVVSLPFDPSKAGSFCLNSLAELAASAELASAGTCNATVVEAVLGEAAARAEAAAASSGLHAYVAYSVGGGAACSVTIMVRVSQDGVIGPNGPFNWSVEEEERVP